MCYTPKSEMSRNSLYVAVMVSRLPALLYSSYGSFSFVLRPLLFSYMLLVVEVWEVAGYKALKVFDPFLRMFRMDFVPSRISVIARMVHVCAYSSSKHPSFKIGGLCNEWYHPRLLYC